MGCHVLFLVVGIVTFYNAHAYDAPECYNAYSIRFVLQFQNRVTGNCVRDPALSLPNKCERVSVKRVHVYANGVIFRGRGLCFLDS